MRFYPRRATLIFLTTLSVSLTLSGGQGSPVLAAKGKAAVTAESMPAPTGRVTYNMKVMSLTGTLKVIWAEGGKKSRSDISMSGTLPGAPAGGSNTTMAAWGISDGKYVYSHQPMMGKSVYRMKMPQGATGAAGTPGSVPAAQLKKAKVLGKGTVIGKPCEIRDVQGVKVWVWKGLVLKTESQGGMSPNLTATKLEMPYKASPALFKVPAGYTVSDTPPAMGGPGGPGGGAPPIRKGSQ